MYSEKGSDEQPPTVIIWAKVLTLTVAFTYLLLIGFGVWAYGDPRGLLSTISSDQSNWPPQIEEDLKRFGLFYVCAGAIFLPFHVWLAFAPRKPWVYVCHCVNIVLAILSCIYVPCAVPVGVLFLDKRVREYFSFR